MKLDKLDREILEIVANEDGISTISLKKKIKGTTRNNTKQLHIKKLSGVYIKAMRGTVLSLLPAGKAALQEDQDHPTQTGEDPE